MGVVGVKRLFGLSGLNIYAARIVNQNMEFQEVWKTAEQQNFGKYLPHLYSLARF